MALLTIILRLQLVAAVLVLVLGNAWLLLGWDPDALLRGK